MKQITIMGQIWRIVLVVSIPLCGAAFRTFCYVFSIRSVICHIILHRLTSRERYISSFSWPERPPPFLAVPGGLEMLLSLGPSQYCLLCFFDTSSPCHWSVSDPTCLLWWLEAKLTLDPCNILTHIINLGPEFLEFACADCRFLLSFRHCSCSQYGGGSQRVKRGAVKWIIHGVTWSLHLFW